MITVKNLKKTYDRGRNAAAVLRELSFELPKTGFVCILGPSGCGKTSLLNAMGGLDRFDSGTVAVNGKSLGRYGSAAFEAERSRSFSYIFQNYYLLSEHSVAYNIYLGLHSLELSHEEKLKRVDEALSAVDMRRFSRRTVGTLSGGQQQRVAIARALARRSSVIFADEPTGNLDEANTLNICSLLKRISKESLVIMVTHEQSLAHFYADRIITLSEGRITADSTDFLRSELTADAGTLYAGDYQETILQHDALRLQLLTEPGAAPVALTVLALSDRVVIKVKDERSISCGAADEAPAFRQGKRPVLKPEGESADLSLFSPEPLRQGKAGAGLDLKLLWQQAKRLFSGGGAKAAGMRIFLMALCVVSLLALGDYIAVSSIDPEDFITTDSHILQVNIAQGETMYEDGKNFNPVLLSYYNELKNSDLDIRFVPHVSPTAKHSVELFRQMEAVSLQFGKFSYAPLEALDESTLILGRMPETSGEIVVDRWVLENALASDGIIQNSIYDIDYFLGVQLHYSKVTYSPTIVGICDAGEPTMYLPAAGLVSLGVAGTSITPLSELKALDPETYGSLTLDSDECLVVVNNAGVSYHRRVGEQYAFSLRTGFTIKAAIEAEVTGFIVVDDSVLDDLLWDMVSDRFYLYCADKQAVMDVLSAGESEVEQAGWAQITLTDRHGEAMRSYSAAATRRADARSIVTVTILALCLVMLALLCRAQANGRIGLIAVYRLLGIPPKKLYAIFAMECALGTARLILPACAATWLALQLLQRVNSLAGAFRLNLPAAAGMAAVIAIYYLAVSLLPLASLLRASPAKLAAKYDL